MSANEYLPFRTEVREVIRHTDKEFTFRLSYTGPVRPGQFFEVSMPRYGEAPISVSGIGADSVDLTIRRVGRVTNEIFERYQGRELFMRGPYGNGFDLDDYRGRELVVVSGGTGVSPVRGVVEHFSRNLHEVKALTLLSGFKSDADILFREDFRNWRQACKVVMTVHSADQSAECRLGQVQDFIPELEFADPASAAAIVVGSPSMMRYAVQALLAAGFREENVWISQERKMCCGIGKCGHCKIGEAYVCLDGPVFRYDRGKNLLD